MKHSNKRYERDLVIFKHWQDGLKPKETAAQLKMCTGTIKKKFSYFKKHGRVKPVLMGRGERVIKKEVSPADRVKILKKALLRASDNSPAAKMFVEVAVLAAAESQAIKYRASVRKENYPAWLQDALDITRFIHAHTYPQLEAAGVDSGYVSRLFNELGFKRDLRGLDIKRPVATMTLGQKAVYAEIFK